MNTVNTTPLNIESHDCGVFIKVPEWLAWMGRKGLVSTSAMILWGRLFTLIRKKGYAYCSQEYLVATTTMSNRTLRLALRELERLGLVKTTRENQVGGRNNYRLFVPSNWREMDTDSTDPTPADSADPPSANSADPTGRFCRSHTSNQYQGGVGGVITPPVEGGVGASASPTSNGGGKPPRNPAEPGRKVGKLSKRAGKAKPTKPEPSLRDGSVREGSGEPNPPENHAPRPPSHAPVGKHMAEWVNELIAMNRHWVVTQGQRFGVASSLRKNMALHGWTMRYVEEQTRGYAVFQMSRGGIGWGPNTFFQDPEILTNANRIWSRKFPSLDERREAKATSERDAFMAEVSKEMTVNKPKP